MSANQKRLVKKITLKEVLGNLQKLAARYEEGTSVPVVRIMGVANGVRVAQSNFGDSIGFKGQFEAVNLLTGELVMGGETFLPDVIANPLHATLNSVEDGANVEFAFDISLRIDESIARGYKFEATPLTQAKHDPLAALRGAMPDIPALASPQLDDKEAAAKLAASEAAVAEEHAREESEGKATDARKPAAKTAKK